VSLQEAIEAVAGRERRHQHDAPTWQLARHRAQR
jgi:hypothetical protein